MAQVPVFSLVKNVIIRTSLVTHGQLSSDLAISRVQCQLRFYQWLSQYFFKIYCFHSCH